MKKRILHNIMNYYDSRDSLSIDLSNKKDSKFYKNTYLKVNFQMLKLKAFFESLHLMNNLISYFDTVKDSILIIEDRPYFFDKIFQITKQRNFSFYLGKWTNGFLTNCLFAKPKQKQLKTNLTKMPALVIIINSENIKNIINECSQKGIPYLSIVNIKRYITKFPYPIYSNSNKFNILIS
jgi:ribosomal protein S2